MSDKTEDAPKKKGKLGKLLVLGVGLIVLVGGGVGAGLYAASTGLVGGGGHAEAENETKPKLVLKSEQKRGEEGDAKGGDAPESTHEGKPTPEVAGGEKYASNYYAMEKEFTSNLQNSVHFIQVGVAVSTPYDDTVIERLKTNDIAVRSAILMALSDTSEEQVFTGEGKKQLQRKLAKAINETLEQKEGFGGVSNVYFTNFVVQ
ncbi:MAG TPA: flagellar basal body-associated FliL family protein [Sphingomonas sp.]|jgi:flagellar FliL protein|uniref:flagellar basal body-associated FliL family protein n=1 Tax=Sphingomonas sp. TaxID=28214 RepID=UPI002EDA60B4